MKKKTSETNPFGVCALCQLEKVRIKSHIIPNFILNRLRNKNQQYFKLDGTTDRAEITHKDYWRYLLCEDCDRKTLGTHEGFVAPVFEKWTNAPDRSTACEVSFDLAQAKFDSILYVVLSIFWRCSVADGHEYSGFKLPPEDEEALRLFLLNPATNRQTWRLSPAFIDPWEAVELVDLCDWANGHTVFLAWLQLAGIAWFLHKDPIRGLTEADRDWTGPFPITDMLNLPGNGRAADLAAKITWHFR